MSARPDDPLRRHASRLVLPVDDTLEALAGSLRSHGAAVLAAPPGAGKSTRVPPALLDAGLAPGKRVLVLQPRRVAATAVARRVAHERGVRMGDEVGWHVRFDRRLSRQTRLIFMTSGMFLRWLHADPFLEDVGCVVVDEVHERSLQIDMALALLDELRRSGLRDDLRVLAMSATLDAERVAALLGGAPPIVSAGRMFQVATEYAQDPRGSQGRAFRDGRGRLDRDGIATAVRDAVIRLLGDSSEPPGGDVLVFLPGRGEIARAAEALERDAARLGVEVVPLHGGLSLAAQDAALTPGARPRVVLSTNIAETSLTVPSVGAVVDAGLARVPRWEPRLDLQRLETARISRASADQRAGRAGRVQAGRCLRLWGEHDHATRAAFDTPEILRADLRALVLQCATWGCEPEALRWLDAPPPAALDIARRALRDSGALDEAGLTERGRGLSALPLAPHIGGLVIAGAALDDTDSACGLAAVISERAADDAAASWRLDAGAVRRLLGQRPPVARVAKRLVALAREQDGARANIEVDGPGAWQAAAKALGALEAIALSAMPGRLARRRSNQGEGPHGDRWTYQLAAGGEATLRSGREPPRWLLASGVSLSGRGAEARAAIRHALVLDEEAFSRWYRRFVPQEPTVVVDEAGGGVRLRASRRLGAMVLSEDQPNAGTFADPALAARARREASAAMTALALRHPARAVPLDETLQQTLGRLALWRDAGASEAAARWIAGCLRAAGLHPHEAPAAHAAETAADEQAPAVLVAACQDARSLAALAQVRWPSKMLDGLPWPDRGRIDEALPTRLRLAGGREVRVRYGLEGERSATPSRPVVAARLQDFFGTESLPDIGGGPPVVHLLAPNGRPAQVTVDLAGFWRGSYAEVRRSLRGRYPKHPWPEDPLSAEALAAARPRPRRGGGRRRA